MISLFFVVVIFKVAIDFVQAVKPESSLGEIKSSGHQAGHHQWRHQSRASIFGNQIYGETNLTACQQHFTLFQREEYTVARQVSAEVDNDLAKLIFSLSKMLNLNSHRLSNKVEKVSPGDF